MAALMVVAWHAEGQMGLAGTRILQSGIEFFFIISGFVMWLVSDNDASRPVSFMMRRLARIVPLYWVLTSVVVAVALVAPRLLQSIRLSPAHVTASYLFIPWLNPTPGVGVRPLLIPGWTLNFEMAFYILVATSLVAPRRWRAALTISMLVGTATFGMLARQRDPIFAFYASPLVAEFALGIALALIIRALPTSVMRWGAPIAILGAGLLVTGGQIVDSQASGRLLLFGLPAMLIVGGAAMWERDKQRPTFTLLKMLGDASFPLYLIHTLLLSALAQAWRHAGLAALPWAYVALGVALSCIIGVSLHFSVEKPLTRALQSRTAHWFVRVAIRSTPSPAAPSPP